MRLWLVLAVCLVSRPLFADRDAELVVIVHPHNHAKIAADALEGMFLRKDRHWPDGAPVVPLNLAPDSAPRRTFDRAVLRMDPDEVARYWLDQRIRDGTNAPREVGDSAVVVKLVAHFEGAIGYVPADTELAGVVVVAHVHRGAVTP